MPVIILETLIHATPEICFDLSRSIDLHQNSMAHTNERAVQGTTSGLIGLGETVTWEAVHFGIRQNLTVRITEFNRPFHFRDELVEGAFASMVHDHSFTQQGDAVLMTDRFSFESPGSIFGRLFNKLILTRYMTKLLKQRNQLLKEESEKVMKG